MSETHCGQCGKKFGLLSGKQAHGTKVICGACAGEVKREAQDEEARRLAELRSRVDAAMVTTTQALDGYRVGAYFGAVSAFSVLKLDFMQEFAADIGDWWGGSSRGYEQKFAALQAEVEQKLKYHAVSRGGNCVIACKFDVQFTETNSGASKVLSAGNAMIRKLVLSGSGTAVAIQRL